MPIKRELWSGYCLNWQQKRIAEGKCSRCGNPREGKYKRWCDACGEKHRQENAANYRATATFRQVMGLCRYCGKDRDTPRSKECCLACLEMRAAQPAQQRSHERRRKERERRRLARAKEAQCDTSATTSKDPTS